MKMNFLGLSIALLALACMGSSNAQDCGTDLSNLVVGINVNPLAPGGGIVPYTSALGGLVQGSDIQVACELQRQLGFNNITFVNFTTPAALSAALAAGSITVAISDLSITPAATTATTDVVAIRYMNDQVGFVFPSAADLAGYIDGNAEIFAAGSASRALPDLAPDRDTTITGATVAVIEGSNEEAILSALVASNFIRGTQVKRVPNTQSLPTLVRIMDTPVGNQANLYFLKNPTALTVAPAANVLQNVIVPITLVPATAPLLSSGLGVFVNAACPQLAVNIQTALNIMVSNGFFANLGTSFPTLVSGGALPATATIFPAGTGTGLTSTAPVRKPLSLFILNTFCPGCTNVAFTDIAAGATMV